MHGGDGEQKTCSKLLNTISSLQNQRIECEIDKDKQINIKNFKQIDDEISHQIADNHHALKRIPEVYSDVLDKIKIAQDKVSSCQDKIRRCKNSLQCKRDDLKRLYIDSVKDGEILQLLGRIERVKEVPAILDKYTKSKHYQHATRLLKTNVALLEGDIACVEALRDLKADLRKRKDMFHEELIKQLQNHLYLKTSSALKKVQLFRSGEPPEMCDEDEYEDEEEDLTKDPEEDTYAFLKLLVQSLQQLDKLGFTVDEIEKNMEHELWLILVSTTNELLHKKRLCNQVEDQPALFQELLEECFAKYRAVAASHHVVINAIEHLTYSRTASRYTDQIVWSRIQHSVEVLLKEYLAFNTIKAGAVPLSSKVSFAPNHNEIGVYFSRMARKPERSTKDLFQFNSSSTGIRVSTDMSHRVQQYTTVANMTQEIPPLCEKSPHNITLVFKLIINFIREIDNVINVSGNQNIPLAVFLSTFVDDSFLPMLEHKYKAEVDSATQGNQGLTAVKLPQKQSLWPRPLLQGTITVQNKVAELRVLMNRMPKYSSRFLDIICNVLDGYKDSCASTYKNIIELDSRDESTQMLCAKWFKDKEINSIIRKLPMWVEIFPTANENTSTTSHADLANAVKTHIGIDPLEKKYLISETESLLQLAQLHDSIMWLVNYIKTFTRAFEKDREVMEQLDKKTACDYMEHLLNTCSELVTLAEDCIMILFLELRVNCYYHLLIVLRKQQYKLENNESLDPDSGVTLLNKFLSQLDEKIREYLPASHTKFLFDGLGHVMSGIIIGSASFIDEMDSNGLKKMSRNIFALQQNLTNITLTCELDLERASFYYELLYQTPEEVLRNIVERERRFSKDEYTELIQLYYRASSRKGRKGVNNNMMKQHLTRLDKIMSDDGLL